MIAVLKISHLEQLNNEIFALLPTRFSCLKIDHLVKRIGIIGKRLNTMFSKYKKPAKMRVFTKTNFYYEIGLEEAYFKFSTNVTLFI
ncbi:hypothetical protein C1E23_02055 [Pseudoalteromonas phenolica]|uniref:Uncharacterized protein n=1 Tax=Pseudoalteromonas phenolica TaxID=161398 RepID=A0A4Q7ISK2_9GAMM|nr:hypothetical protein C1E23_02055 [Pseudoalteromonas phenolica]